MENQHRKITGYRELNESEIALMNRIKAQGEALAELVDEIEHYAGVDPLWCKIGTTNLQHGIMDLVRAVAKPESF